MTHDTSSCGTKTEFIFLGKGLILSILGENSVRRLYQRRMLIKQSRQVKGGERFTIEILLLLWLPVRN